MILFYIYAVNAEIWLWLNKKIKLALFLLLLVRELSCCPYFGAKNSMIVRNCQICLLHSSVKVA
ncbi:hypothetical protein C3Y93_08250 [Acinetobacter sp. SWBY1]|nr:hypothetical protein C3Y93_08250 [Acinetobacter sp. SWBY1]